MVGRRSKYKSLEEAVGANREKSKKYYNEHKEAKQQYMREYYIRRSQQTQEQVIQELLSERSAEEIQKIVDLMQKKIELMQIQNQKIKVLMQEKIESVTSNRGQPQIEVEIVG